MSETENAVMHRTEAQPPTIGDTPGQLLGAIVQLAKDPSVDVAKLSALLDMQRQMEASAAEAAFNRAFNQMEPELPRIKKNGTVAYEDKKTGQMKDSFKFARWEDVDDGIRPILRRFGFSLSFDSVPRSAEGGGLIVTGRLLHVDGHSKSASIPLPLDTSGGKNNLQGAGSTFSYGKRYATQMLLNIVTEGQDDDGVQAGFVFIGPAEVQRLKDLIKSSNSNESAFLDYMNVATLAEILQSEFPSAVNALLAKKAKNGGMA